MSTKYIDIVTRLAAAAALGVSMAAVLGQGASAGTLTSASTQNVAQRLEALRTAASFVNRGAKLMGDDDPFSNTHSNSYNNTGQV